ncbi:hypothetical protein LXM94_24090, partial [Rhizobium sp. TRM95111]|uniref:hypothetical protein n=1 Tax=Rhizobium alarense TaxID=2846851 RepID=UPI001F3AB9AB
QQKRPCPRGGGRQQQKSKYSLRNLRLDFGSHVREPQNTTNTLHNARNATLGRIYFLFFS